MVCLGINPVLTSRSMLEEQFSSWTYKWSAQICNSNSDTYEVPIP